MFAIIICLGLLICTLTIRSSVLCVLIEGCAFSDRPLARGDSKCWWAIGKHFNGRPPGEWK